jgi:hypothetical protein
MAKKSTFSHVQAQQALEAVADSLTAENLPYELLRVFCGYGDSSLQRVRDGRDNKSRDEDTILVKDKLVYRLGNLLDEPLDIINLMLKDPRIIRHNPRLYITVKDDTVIAWDPKDDEVYENKMSLIWKDFEFFKPLAGIEKFRNVSEAEADVKTAELMAKIYDDIRRYNDVKDPQVSHHINIFMSRLLFCFFAEDTGLFAPNQFTKAIQENTKADGSDLADFIDRLFFIMSTDNKEIRENQTNTVISSFPYVNGGLFSQRYPIPTLSRRARQLMIKCGSFEWGEINPDIFGSMTQAIVSPEDRAELGIHYTSVPNIMKVIQPLFLDDLAQEYIRCKNDIKGLDALLVRMGKIKFFDPACGSGNFLIISYKRLRELEIEIWKRLVELGSPRLPFSEIALTQFYGIELDEYACDTATLSLWLAEHQMNNKFRDNFGTCPNPLPLRPSGHVVCGNALTTDWKKVCPNNGNEEIYVMGNPPYLGSKLQSESQKHDMVSALSDLKDKKGMDYIAGWFWKGAKYIRGNKARYAFVTTNSISQGEQVGMLWRPILNLGLTISFAHTSFKWSNNAKHNAAVICEIIGISNAYAGKRRFFNENTQTELRVDNINPYLVVGENTIVDKTYQIPKGRPKATFGCMPYDNGNLILSPEEADCLIKSYPESKKFIKKLVGSQEFQKGLVRYCLWIDDSEVDEANAIPPIAKRIKATSEFRLKQGVEELAKRGHQFREYFVRDCDVIIIPGVSSERRDYIPMGMVGKDTVVSNSAFAIYCEGEPDYTLLGILMSKLHNTWAHSVGGKLKNDYRYSATLCYNTFPFPRLTEKQRDLITGLTKEILLTRAGHSEMTLGDMYNPENFPKDLAEAHHALDLAVERCYREKPFESDEERLEYLFKQYTKLTTDKSTLWKI